MSVSSVKFSRKTIIFPDRPKTQNWTLVSLKSQLSACFYVWFEEFYESSAKGKIDAIGLKWENLRRNSHQKLIKMILIEESKQNTRETKNWMNDKRKRKMTNPLETEKEEEQNVRIDPVRVSFLPKSVTTLKRDLGF